MLTLLITRGGSRGGGRGVRFLSLQQGNFSLFISLSFLHFSHSTNRWVFPSFFLLRHNAILAWEFFHHFLWPITVRTLARQLPAFHCIACCCSFSWRRHFVALCVNIFAWCVLQIKLQANCGLGFACLPPVPDIAASQDINHIAGEGGREKGRGCATLHAVRCYVLHLHITFPRQHTRKKESKQISAAFILMHIPTPSPRATTSCEYYFVLQLSAGNFSCTVCTVLQQLISI